MGNCYGCGRFTRGGRGLCDKCLEEAWMKVCPGCHEEIDGECNYCPSCGEKVV